MDKNYLETKKYLKEINSIEKKYTMSLKYIKDKKFFLAITVLLKIDKKMNSAGKKLNGVRKLLAVRIPQYEKDGIAAYEDKKYNKCIIFH